MNTQDISESEYLALVTNYPYLLKKTIIKPNFFSNAKNKTLFEILLTEIQKADDFVIGNLVKYKNFDNNYFIEIMQSNMWNSNREVKFKELEKNLIESFKQRAYQHYVTNFDGDRNKLYEQLTKINEINYFESEYLKAEEIYNSISEQKQQIKLGFSDLDYALNLSQNDLMILAGGTGTGKTAFCLNLLSNLSKDYQCIYFNMEMGKSVLYKRLVAINTGRTLWELNHFERLDYAQKVFIKEKLNEIESRKIILVNKSIKLDEITRYIQEIKTDKHIIVFLDHIGLIKTKGSSLYEKMTEVAKEIRSISMNNNCTIIGLCQLSRESQKEDTVPKLQDLRDSGEIEQSARKVVMLQNKAQNLTDRVHDMKVIIAKNDDGNRIVKDFKFDRYTQRFSEVGNMNERV